MKAKELKRLLKQADDEMEVFVSPLILMRSMKLGLDDGTLEDDEFIETSDRLKSSLLQMSANIQAPTAKTMAPSI